MLSISIAPSNSVLSNYGLQFGRPLLSLATPSAGRVAGLLKKKLYLCSMKHFYFLLLFSLLGFALQGQEIRLGTALPVDTVVVESDPLLNPCRVQRELLLLQDAVDDWRTELSEDNEQSEAWRRDHGRLHTWRIGVDATTFLRDAAFSLPFTRGYTATGFFLSPYAKHLLGSDAQLTLGVHLAGAAGYDGIRAWQPLVRLEYEPFEHFRLVMGSLYGTLAHGLFEPMLGRERYIYAHQEEGVQILTDYRLGSHQRWRMDTWLHWEDLLEPWQPKQERFTLGSSQELTLYTAAPYRSNVGGVEVSVPFSFLGCHRGGQFSSLDTCIQSLFNESVGLRVNLPLGQRAAVAVDAPFFFYQDISPTKCMAYNSGWALWPQLSLDWQFAREGRNRQNFWRGAWRMLLQAGYWQGHQFIAPRGSYLFQSVSWHRPDYAEPERRMVTAKLAFENRYTSRLALGLDTEYYYDLAHRAMDFAFGLYIRYGLMPR